MSTPAAPESADDSASPSNSEFPGILLASDRARSGQSLERKLTEEGFSVHLASGYQLLEDLWRQHRHPVILLDVSSVHAVEQAIAAAINIKRQDPGQFVGYLADPILRTAGLAGDVILPRNPHQLPGALRSYFGRLPQTESPAAE